MACLKKKKNSECDNFSNISNSASYIQLKKQYYK